MSRGLATIYQEHDDFSAPCQCAGGYNNCCAYGLKETGGEECPDVLRRNRCVDLRTVDW